MIRNFKKLEKGFAYWRKGKAFKSGARNFAKQYRTNAEIVMQPGIEYVIAV